MKIRIDRRNVDLNKYPFRGILAEIARERGVSRQAVQKSASNGNPEILAAVTKKAKKRLDKVNSYKRLTA